MSKEKVEKIENKKTDKKEKGKQSNWFKRTGAWFKRTFSGMWQELKKVSWPKFSKVVKQTGMVLAVVLFFMVVITAINLGLSELLNLINING